MHNRFLCAIMMLMPLGGLTGCGYTDSRTAHRAQLAMIGMKSDEVQSCVGVPDKIKKLNDNVQVFEYVRTINVPSANDSTLFPLQTIVNLTETTLGGAGKTCIADIRLENDTVTDLHYSGDDDEIVGTDGVCSIVARGCIRKPVSSMRHVKAGIFGPVSAFSSPKEPDQSPTTTVSASPTAATPSSSAAPAAAGGISAAH
ncbi:hypothetical protein [Novacetimonas cocois]|uniref:hypothetical protein n=1 Tax=Novacetimonas cocois TaxID=1747507 RepID=UPI001EF12764|nr:hypothetical protein [Novacetimonas cocois]